MNLEVVPYHGMGPLELGMSRDRVRKIFGGNFKSSEKEIQSGIPVPARDLSVELGVRVEYDEQYNCCSIEATYPAQPTFQGILLLEKPFRGLREWFLEKEPKLKVDDFGFTSFLFGIGVYAPSAEENLDRTAESVIVFRRGYYGSAHS